MRRVQFVFRKVTSACPKIGPGVAQHIDQLKRHAVPSAESKHFILGAVREIANVAETDSGPEFTDTTGHQIRIFIEIGSGAKRANFRRLAKALEIEHLPARNLFEHDANIIAVCMLHLIEPQKAIG